MMVFGLFSVGLSPEGVSPRAAAQDQGVGCSTGMPLEGPRLHPAEGWVG